LQRLLTCALLLGLSTASVPLQAQDASVGTPPALQDRSASVSGTVLDSTGAAVAGAGVTVTGTGNSQVRSTVTGRDGSFSVSSLVPDSYIVIVKAKGFQPTTSGDFDLAANQVYQMPGIVLSIATATTEIVVQPTEVIAAQQMKAEEKQRLFGVIPDFYTSYLWNAAPLNTKQKFSMALRDTLDPTTFAGISIGAGIQQARNVFPGYGQGAEGYAKRWGALFANGRTSDILSRAVFPSLFHQDPRYFYQGTGSTWSRTNHAVAYAFVARNDSGHLMPNYSYFLADLCSGAISNAYYPASSRGASLVFTNAALGIAGRVGQDMIREFLLKHVTKNVPGNGKPASGNHTQDE